MPMSSLSITLGARMHLALLLLHIGNPHHLRAYIQNLKAYFQTAEQSAVFIFVRLVAYL